ncbi:chromatin assembly factor 1 subunit A-domain-containing protein [Sordaria brevicollis]|uniref:Chromatin assembly factor 1 subunit A-domain-containing protein n=1 Tax=Sordaria brevicollis TaxID=83679 RepID=A0AAE0P2K9_SORBR|nr:chromatin assembly factor 1 subunit A-domain-containing protein [Sordaria brevicollis]
MPLFTTSTSGQGDSSGLKRSHDQFREEVPPPSSFDDKENLRSSPPPPSSGPATPRARKASPALSDASSPLDRLSRSPSLSPPRLGPLTISTNNATSTQKPTSSAKAASTTSKTTTGAPAPKRKKLTPEEKAAKAEADAAKKKEKEEAKAKKAAEQAKLEAEKQQKAEERERKKREKEEELKRKQEEKEEKERKKREKEEEEAKKKGRQMKLTSLFKINPATPKEKPAAVAIKVESKDVEMTDAPSLTKEDEAYRRLFKPFYVKEFVTLAKNPFEVDEETREAKSRILDEYAEGRRAEFPIPAKFDPLEALQLPFKTQRRGRPYPSVRKIMTEIYGESTSKPMDLTTENTQFRDAREALKAVPVKCIKFSQDVRPPYVGTISGLPPGVKSLYRLARNPTSRNLLPLDYDYDSEAEWQDEEGEDVEDLDDEEEDLEMDEDMDDFLDDSEDVGPQRLVFSGGMEPESTGICWENEKRCTAKPELYQCRMEIILDSLDEETSIDPFSTDYWPSKSKTSSSGNEKSSVNTSTSITAQAGSSSTSSLLHPSSAATSTSAKSTKAAGSQAPTNAFQALTKGTTTGNSPSNKATPTASAGSTIVVAAASSTPAGGALPGGRKPPGRQKMSDQPLPAAAQEQLKELMHQMPMVSKLGIIEVFASQHPDMVRAQIKASFESMTEKQGKSGWKWKE